MAAKSASLPTAGAERSSAEKQVEPIRICIAALGGEGGSVLTSWIVALATAEGWPVQSTSIPGVAQRTGATTYYIEMLPERWDRPDSPIFALTPTPGFVDIVVATELLEAGRVIEQGLVSPNRTTLLASPHRAYTIEEKSGMADERISGERILKAIEEVAARAIVIDMADLAKDARAIVSSVVFGALAAARVLPFDKAKFEAVLRSSEIAVDANLRGFEAAYGAVLGARPATTDESADHLPEPPPDRHLFPAEVEAIVRHGVERLSEYQDPAYAERYLSSVARVEDAEREIRGTDTKWSVTREAARYLALMMSYEDIIRVAALKTKRDRWEEIRSGNPQGSKDLLKVTEFLKPGIEEFASLLPPALGRRIVEGARKRGKLDAYNFGLQIRTTSVAGFMTMRLLARLRPWRPRSYRFQKEMKAIEEWLDLVVAATRIDPDFGLQVVDTARLRKGYGATHRRGAANFSAILKHVVRPAIAEDRSAADRVAEMNGIALADPEGDSLITALRA
ncbi:MAG: indolepyruvate oxidoreductase subunit beta family protein [Rhodovibrionaceae bacterium]